MQSSYVYLIPVPISASLDGIPGFLQVLSSISIGRLNGFRTGKLVTNTTLVRVELNIKKKSVEEMACFVLLLKHVFMFL